MKYLIVLMSVVVLNLSAFGQEDAPIALVIHGGAGTIVKEKMSIEKRTIYEAKLDEALSVGYQILEEGGSAMEAVQASIKILEDSPLFNAGRGSVFNSEGENEMDASIMDGKTLEAGAVSGLQKIKNPIMAASKVLTSSKHVMLSGKGAYNFSKKQGLTLASDDYFHDKRRFEQYKRRKEKEAKAAKDQGFHFTPDPQEKYGTVGAVALDKDGNIVAGTSTGGMTYKKYGRIGDTPIIGAGTYANNDYCGVSSTGHGEYFIRGVVAYDICAKMKYGEMSLKDAAYVTVHSDLDKLGGKGGIIAIDNKGNISMEFNTSGMYRASISSTSEKYIGIFGD